MKQQHEAWSSVVTRLQLEGHLEGGFFRRIYCSEQSVNTPYGDRPSMTSIYYLLTSEQPLGSLHVNRSDIVHYFIEGGELTYHLYNPVSGEYICENLNSQNPTLIVPGGWWKASHLRDGNFGLICEAVTPGFVYEDMALIEPLLLQERLLSVAKTDDSVDSAKPDLSGDGYKNSNKTLYETLLPFAEQAARGNS